MKHDLGKEALMKNAKILCGDKIERPPIIMRKGKPQLLYAASGVNFT